MIKKFLLSSMPVVEYIRPTDTEKYNFVFIPIKSNLYSHNSIRNRRMQLLFSLWYIYILTILYKLKIKIKYNMYNTKFNAIQGCTFN